MKREHLHIRIGKEDQNILRQMDDLYKKGVSKLVRMAIRYAYDNPGNFDYFMAKEELDIESE